MNGPQEDGTEDSVTEPEETTEDALTEDSEVSDALAAEDAPVTTSEAPSDAAASAVESDETLTSLKARLSPEDYQYVVDTREEAARYRTERNRFRDAFEGFDEDGIEAFLGAVRAIRENPAEAYEGFSGLVAALADAAGITEEQAQDLVDEAAKQDEVADEDLTVEERVEKVLADREAKQAAEKAEADRKAAEEEQIKVINKEIEDLGYSNDLSDPNKAIEYTSLLNLAAEHTNGDLAEADKLFKAYVQGKIDEAVSGEQQIAEAFPPQTSGSAGSGNESRPKVKGVDEAAKLARKKLDATFGEQSE